MYTLLLAWVLLGPHTPVRPVGHTVARDSTVSRNSSGNADSVLKVGGAQAVVTDSLLFPCKPSATGRATSKQVCAPPRRRKRVAVHRVHRVAPKPQHVVPKPNNVVAARPVPKKKVHRIRHTPHPHPAASAGLDTVRKLCVQERPMTVSVLPTIVPAWTEALVPPVPPPVSLDLVSLSTPPEIPQAPGGHPPARLTEDSHFPKALGYAVVPAIFLWFLSRGGGNDHVITSEQPGGPPVTSVPEPGTPLLVGSAFALLACAVFVRRRGSSHETGHIQGR